MAPIHFLCLAAFLLELPMSYQEDSRNSTLPRAEDNSRYKTIQANSTLLKLLMEPNKDENTRSEIFDMLHSKDSEFTKEPTGPAFPEDVQDRGKDVVSSQPPNMQAELVQGAESIVERDSKVRMWVPGDHSQDTGGRGAVVRGAMSGIMVGVTCAIVLAAYIGLVAYKRHEMIKNGAKHELLRNEETTNETRIEL